MTVEPEHRPARRRSLRLLSLLLILSTSSSWLTESVVLVRPNVNCVLQPESAWNVPAAQFSQFQMPFLAFSILGAILVSALTCGLDGYRPSLRSLTGLCGLSLLLTPEFLLFGYCIWFVRTGLTSTTRSQFSAILISVAGVAVAFLMTLEFGLVALAAVVESLVKWKTGRAPKLIFFATIVIAACVLVSVPESHPTLLRFVNWSSVDSAQELIPSLRPTFTIENSRFACALLMLFCLPCAFRNNVTAFSAFWVATLTALAGACFHYLWPAAAIIAAFSFSPANSAPPGRQRTGWVLVAGFVIAGIRLFSIGPEIQEELLVADSASGRLNPAEWNSAGNVMLFNLDGSHEWESQTVRERFRLVLNDRWDIFQQHYKEYRAACRDFRETRSHGYVLDNGDWGGYALLLRLWKPTLLVLDSNDSAGIRGLSVSPDYKFMGMDRSDVIFGRSTDAGNTPRINVANRSLLKLEWPANISLEAIAETVVTQSADDRQRAARGLLNLRLPYAALRYVEDDSSSDANDLRSRCYVELAHRIYRHSGHTSILHHCRAIVSARNRLSQSSTLKEPSRNHLLGFIRSTESMAVPQQPSGTADSQVRCFLTSGNIERARANLSKVSAANRDAYRVLIDFPDLIPVEAARRLRKSISSITDDRFRSEVQFFVGCLELESGNARQALEDLEQSEETFPGLPFRAIRRMHLSRLMAQ